MDRDMRAKLDELLEKQASFQAELCKLGGRSAELEQEISRLTWEIKTADAAKRRNQVPEAPPVSPPPLPTELEALAEAETVLAPRQQGDPTPSTAPENPTSEPQKKAEPSEPAGTGEWELTFGRVWLVRIGVLLLLTGFIFLSTYAYKNWLFNAGTGIKVAFFMTVSLALTGAGLWLEQWKKRFRQYGRVVASGGLAIGYYTVYASHFVPSLKILTSPVIAATLLTLWAGVMLAYAIWKKSRIVAVMAIGLAFYGTIANPAGWISLFSALLLSASGIWLMLRFRWISIGLGTVIAAYTSHMFWLEWFPGEVGEGVRLTYLASYWLLFTVAMMVPQARKLPDSVQRGIVALNNSTAWFLTVFALPLLVPHQEIGWISLGVGTFWLLLAAAARTGRLWSRSLAVIFGYQGLLIASLGILIEATGYSRFLVLAVEACILLAGARQFGGALARVASVGAFAAALVTAAPEMNGGITAGWQAYAALAILCAAYTALVKRDQHGTQQAYLVVIPAAITWLVLGVGVFYQWQPAAGVNALWVSILTFMLGYQLLPRLRSIPGLLEMAVVAIPVAFIACWWYIDLHAGMWLWQSAIPLVGTAAVWWLCPGLLGMWTTYCQMDEEKPNTVLEWAFSIIFWVMLGSTATVHMPSEAGWLVLGGLLALAGHAAAQWTRRRSIGVPALVFHLSAMGCVVTWGNQYPLLAWAPALLLLLHMALVDRSWKLILHKVLLGFFAFVLSSSVAITAFQQFDRPDITLTLLAAAITAWAYHRRDPIFMFAGSVSPLLLACVTTLVIHGETDWLRYPPILVTLLLHGFLWRGTRDTGNNRDWTACRVALLSAGLLALGSAASFHVLRAFQGSGLAICWALLAAIIFCAGLSIRCRPYRLIGLWWLAAAVLHVVCIDVMRLETLGRILSFIILGLVLLALGFLYNKFQETIRKFL